MYVGAAVAAAGTAFVVGNVVAFLGAAIVCLGLVIKARIERNGWRPSGQPPRRAGLTVLCKDLAREGEDRARGRERFTTPFAVTV